MLEAGLVASVHSDDPAHFGGYLHRNLVEVLDALGLGAAAACRLARNSLESSFLETAERRKLLDRLDGYVAGFVPA
jgi:adenosine deaminase